MQGKIFSESADVFQDQARVIFDYYRKAAEQIVTEEIRIETEISGLEETCRQLTAEIAALHTRRIAAFAGAGALALLYFVIGPFALLLGAAAAIFGIVTHSKAGGLAAKLAQSQAAIDGLKTAHSEIRRDYKLHKLGLAYVPVAREIPFEGRSFLIDLTGATPRQEFRLSTVRRGDLFAATIGEMETLLKEAPVVEASTEMEEVPTGEFSRSIQKVSYYDYSGAMDRKLRAAAFCLEDLDTTAVALPTISPQGEMARYLEEHSTCEPSGAPVFRPFDTDRFDAELETFRSLNEMKKSLERHSSQFEDVLRKLMLDMAHAVQFVSRMKLASTGKLVDHSNRLLFTILKAPYNHYSPKLEAEEIDRIRSETFDYQESVESYRPFQLKRSSRVLYDPISECWVAEDGSRTKVPFGISQIQEEIIAPIVGNLMAETRIERLKIYNNIKDQKINYLNQWHRDIEDFYGRNRAEANQLIESMRSTFTEFIAKYNHLTALENTEKSMAASRSLDDTVTATAGDAAETAASFEVKSREFQVAQEEFSDYMDRLKEDIDRRAQKYGFIEYYDASLRDGSAKSFAEAVNQVHTLDARRQPLLAVNPYFAAASELPPPPSLEESAMDGLALNLEAVARGAIADLDRGLPSPSDRLQPGSARAAAAASGGSDNPEANTAGAGQP